MMSKAGKAATAAKKQAAPAPAPAPDESMLDGATRLEPPANKYGVADEQWNAWTVEQQELFNQQYHDRFHSNPKRGREAWDAAVAAADALKD